jgi:hypothetical protein
MTWLVRAGLVIATGAVAVMMLVGVRLVYELGWHQCRLDALQQQLERLR